MNYQALRDDLLRDEGLRLKVYHDPSGFLTIGIGRNLDAVGISRDEANVLLNNDIFTAAKALDNLCPWWRVMSDSRQNALVNMCFNMGPQKLMGFRLFLAALEKNDYKEAVKQMIASDWYNQVGGRAIRLCFAMETG